MSFSIDWHSVFVPAIGIAEVVVRGSIMYLCMLLILRFVGRRQTGSFGPTDLLVIVMIADAAQNGLGKDYNSVTEGVALVLTITGWEHFLDWLMWKFPAIQPIFKPPSLRLVENGRYLSANMNKEMLTEDELRSQLREHEVEDVSEVRLAMLEGDGRLSVLRRKSAGR
jgi:uncharacterized membrane protein YcaP (DUF421 family)